MTSTKKYRYMVAFLACVAVILNSASRVVLSVAIVSMTNGTESSKGNGSEDCVELKYSALQPNATNVNNDRKRGEFYWDIRTQGFLLSSISYGYLITQIPGGMLAGRYGGKKVLGISLGAAGIFSLLVPYAAHGGVGFLITLQIFIGMLLGVDIPVVQCMVGRLAPVMERSRLASIALQGAPLGRLIFLPVAGALCNSDFFGGWPSVYYVVGILMLLWCIPWFFLVKEEQIDTGKLKESSNQRNSVPWNCILLSGPVWAIALAHACYAWLHYTINAFLPTYFTEILKFDIAENGLVSAIPQISSWVMQATTGPFVDCLRRRHFLSTTVARKLFTSLGLFLPILWLSLVYLGECNRAAVVTFISLATGSTGLAMGGFLVNHIDVAHNYAGELMGISNTLASVTGFMAPLATGLIINDNSTRFQWQIVLAECSAIYAFGGVMYLILGNGIEQKWNVQTHEVQEREHLLKKQTEPLG